jgi:hypothetical protein
MSNAQLTALTGIILAAHVGVAIAAAVRRRRAAPMRVLNAAMGAATLAYLGVHPRLFASPVDLQIIALGLFEAGVLLAAATAARGVRATLAVSWIAFAIHLAASAGAVAFALLFKITRLM